MGGTRVTAPAVPLTNGQRAAGPPIGSQVTNSQVTNSQVTNSQVTNSQVTNSQVTGRYPGESGYHGVPERSCRVPVRGAGGSDPAEATVNSPEHTASRVSRVASRLGPPGCRPSEATVAVTSDTIGRAGRTDNGTGGGTDNGADNGPGGGTDTPDRIALIHGLLSADGGRTPATSAS